MYAIQMKNGKGTVLYIDVTNDYATSVTSDITNALIFMSYNECREEMLKFIKRVKNTDWYYDIEIIDL